MTTKGDTGENREWWIKVTARMSIIFHRPTEGAIHVIEHSAYAALKAEFDEANEAFEFIKKLHIVATEKQIEAMKERDAAIAERDEARIIAMNESLILTKERDAAIAALESERTYAKDLWDKLSRAERQAQFTNSNWPHEKKLHEELTAMTARAEAAQGKCELLQKCCDLHDVRVAERNDAREKLKLAMEMLAEGLDFVEHVQHLEYFAQGGSTEHWAHRFVGQAAAVLEKLRDEPQPSCGHLHGDPWAEMK